MLKKIGQTGWSVLAGIVILIGLFVFGGLYEGFLAWFWPYILSHKVVFYSFVIGGVFGWWARGKQDDDQQDT